MSRIITLFKACPCCGKKDDLKYPDEESFHSMYKQNGSAAIKIECQRCDLMMWEVDYMGKDFEPKVAMLAYKWNNRKAEEDVDDGK